jgi:cob(I)alamin adenosyltransferase
MKGYIQVYTGNGKGKTTAAFGLALRAAGAGLKVFIAQFIKGLQYSELDAFSRFEDIITLRQYGRGCFIHNKPEQEDIDCARKRLDEVAEIIHDGKHEVVILDELNIAVYMGLIHVDNVITLIEIKPPHVELIITGRYAHPLIIERADLVTEMKEVKHYFQNGITARLGIEK